MKALFYLPKFLRWLFAFMTGCSVAAGLIIGAVLVVDPPVSAGEPMGTIMSIQPAGAIHLQTGPFGPFGPEVSVAQTSTAASANRSPDAGLALRLRRTGLIVGLAYVVFFSVLFDLMRRMFRNVERGESFTERNVRLVQIVGVSMIVFSFVSSVIESWACLSLATHFSQHVGGSADTLWQVTVRDPSMPFGGSVFFYGLLILALSEVFRQGVAIKRENDLTV